MGNEPVAPGSQRSSVISKLGVQEYPSHLPDASHQRECPRTHAGSLRLRMQSNCPTPPPLPQNLWPRTKPPGHLPSHLCHLRLTKTSLPSLRPHNSFPLITYFPSKLGWNISDLYFSTPEIREKTSVTALDTLGHCDLVGFSPCSSLSSYLLFNTKAFRV